ncbi:uncharacterized protein EHS24_001809 [Apiotrichum porosum]|uniref:F-box domain-containing protein n=1 Tax=Apiotrichum porosum TaxID=105984 RepID=A0A427XJ60_9TREE|nr:uncharacterized protein EHS24_001809 [Apiotrichum porosum]RSH78886.1 hypothetical protein EHS24_001809 [Apiotrichum porosum]
MPAPSTSTSTSTSTPTVATAEPPSATASSHLLLPGDPSLTAIDLDHLAGGSSPTHHHLSASLREKLSGFSMPSMPTMSMSMSGLTLGMSEAENVGAIGKWEPARDLSPSVQNGEKRRSFTPSPSRSPGPVGMSRTSAASSPVEDTYTPSLSTSPSNWTSTPISTSNGLDGSGILLDHSAYPHVMESILHFAPRSVLIALRRTCRRYHDMVDDLFCSDVRITARHGVQSEYYGDIPALGHQLPAGDQRSGSRFPGAAALKDDNYRKTLKRAKRVAILDQPDIPARDLQALSSLLQHVQVATISGAYGLRRGAGCYPAARHHVYFLVPDTLAHSEIIAEPAPPVLPKDLRWLQLVFFCTMSPLGRLEIPVPVFPPGVAVVRLRFKLKHHVRKGQPAETRQASTPPWGFLRPLVARIAETAPLGITYFVDGVNCLSPASLSLPDRWAGHLDRHLREEIDTLMILAGLEDDERERALENVKLRNPRESEYHRVIEGGKV